MVEVHYGNITTIQFYLLYFNAVHDDAKHRKLLTHPHILIDMALSQVSEAKQREAVLRTPSPLSFIIIMGVVPLSARVYDYPDDSLSLMTIEILALRACGSRQLSNRSQCSAASSQPYVLRRFCRRWGP